MLRYIYANDLHKFAKLGRSMFRDRADQFKTRLGWEVSVSETGEERDDYDRLNPLYVICESPAGRHWGSMRFLPTTGRVMINEVFPNLCGGGTITSPFIWECTRFCLSRSAGPRVAAALMLAGGEIMTGFGIRQFAGVFDIRMERIYRAIGSSPEIIGSEGTGRNKISLGLWSFTEDARARVARKAGISTTLSRLWFDRAFGAQPKYAELQTA